MISTTPEPAADRRVDVTKSVWVKPRFDRIDISEAEAGDGTGPDGGLIS